MNRAVVRLVHADDARAWAQLRHELWPHEPFDSLAADVVQYIQGAHSLYAAVFVAVQEEALVGFLELGLRTYAEGAKNTPVPHIEGWYVASSRRRSGVGSALLRAAEEWARAHGYQELTSDTTDDYPLSLPAHIAAGFTEVERLIALHKDL